MDSSGPRTHLDRRSPRGLRRVEHAIRDDEGAGPKGAVLEGRHRVSVGQPVLQRALLRRHRLHGLNCTHPFRLQPTELLG
jgi:hypothetical protein